MTSKQLANKLAALRRRIINDRQELLTLLDEVEDATDVCDLAEQHIQDAINVLNRQT